MIDDGTLFMDTHMKDWINILFGSLTAHCTSILISSCMDSHMSYKNIIAGTHFTAYHTFKWPFPCIDAHMRVQLLIWANSYCTLCIQMTSFHHGHAYDHLNCSSEQHLAAYSTSKPILVWLAYELLKQTYWRISYCIPYIQMSLLLN